MGIVALIGAITDAIAAPITAAAVDLGVSAATAGTIGGIGAGAIEGAGLGAGEAAITGGDPGKGALGGAITAGTLSGLGGPLGTALGSTTAGDIAAGALGGTLGAAATGGSLGSGALGGAVSGGISAALAPTPTATTGAAPTPGGPTSAAATAVPASVPGAVSPDVTSQVAQGLASGNPDFAAGLNSGITATAGPDAAAGFQTGLNATSGPLAPSQGLLLPTGDQAGGALGGGAPGSAGSGLPSGVSTGGGTAGGSDVGSLASSNTPGSVGTGAAAGGINLAGNPNLGTLNAAPPSGIPSTSLGVFAQDPSLSTAWNVVQNNPLQTLAAGALGYDLLNANKSYPGQAQIGGAAQAALAEGNQLQSYLTTGQLPPGLQAQVASATQAAQASVRQQYANRGMSGSSAEAQDLQNVQEQAVAQTGQLATQLFQQGTQETELGTELYGQLMNVAMQQDQQLSSGITNFVSALAGISRPIIINPTGALT